MEINNLFGLPAHPLLVHLPVVMVPMAALGAIILAIFPKLFTRFGWWVTGIAFIGAVGSILAAGSGEKLEQNLGEQSALLERHAQLGEQTRLLSIILFASLLVVMLVRRYKPAVMTKKIVSIVVSVLIGGLSIGAAWAVVETGHNGAKSSWCDVIKNCPAEGAATPGSDGEG